MPIVPATIPLDRIATADLAAVFAGRITNWSELGGPDAPISLHLRNADSGLAQAAVDKLLLPLEQGVGARAARQTIKTEDYPLTAPMFLYIPARRLPRLAREFLFYTQSTPAQIVIRRAGFVDLAPEAIPIAAQGDRFVNAIAQAGRETLLEELQRMVAVLGPMQRLSTTFRFEAGSTRLDAQSRSNVDQLARRLDEGVYDGRKLVFVGFSDGDGAAGKNQLIAERRADAVRQAVVNAAETADFTQIEITTDAFGEAMPMACDDSEWGRQVNRRVEVWVR